MIEAVRDGGNILVTFSSVPARHYRLERASSLTTPDWQTVVGDTVALDSTLQLTDPTSAGGGPIFYRAFLVE